MVSPIYKTVGAAVAAYLLAQQIQCPPVAIPLITSAALLTTAGVGTFAIDVASNVIQSRGRRDLNERQTFTAPAGVPQFEFERCYTDLAQSVPIKVQGPVSNNGVQIDNLPASCMNLATVLDGDAVGGPVPQPCGSACLLYDNLSTADYETMRLLFEDLRSRS